jgi:hypothetical protein
MYKIICKPKIMKNITFYLKKAGMFFSLLIFVFISMTNASCAVITFDNASPN